MVPKPLALSSSFSALYPFSFSPHLINPSTNLNFNILKQHPPKPTSVIICKSAEAHSLQETNPRSSQIPGDPDGGLEPDGSGAAAPTPGQIFLEHQQSMAASAIVLSATRKKKKKGKVKVLKTSSVLPCCYGCGATLQTSETDAPGYVDPDTYQLVRFYRLF